MRKNGRLVPLFSVARKRTKNCASCRVGTPLGVVYSGCALEPAFFSGFERKVTGKTLSRFSSFYPLRHAAFGRLTVAPRPRVGFLKPRKDYLVDPASSHMLVSKIKPCMSKYMPKQGETANGSLNQLWFLRSFLPTWITVAILELIHAVSPKPLGATGAFIRPRSIGPRSVLCGDSG